MKKEQILVIVCAALAALIAWSNTGLYAEVGAGGIGEGSSLDATEHEPFDLMSGLGPAPGGRSLAREVRTEERDKPPEIAAPYFFRPTWVRLQPWPRANPLAWEGQRVQIEQVEASDAPEGEYEWIDPPVVEEYVATDPLADEIERDVRVVAKLVKANGDELPVILTPTGVDAGQPTWVILEKWPNCTFNVAELNKRTGREFGLTTVGPDNIEAYKTVHLERTFLKLYHERRIREGVGPNDRTGLIALARWCKNELAIDRPASNSGKFKYAAFGQDAIQLGITTLRQAWELQSDFAITKELAEFYRAAFDPEGELEVIEKYLEGHANDVGAIKLAGDALHRAGAHGPAIAMWRRGVAMGDLEARMGLAESLYATGDVEGAHAEFTAVHGSGDSLQRAHALEGSARCMIAAGKFDEALSFGNKAAGSAPTDSRVLVTLGAAKYYKGDFNGAEATLKKAVAVSPKHETRALSNHGMTLVALDRLSEARDAFITCLKSDPVNYVDPVLGLAAVAQRRGHYTAAADLLEMGRMRDPSNPWVLLRAGTSKLRDDIPDQALTLARQVLTAAPGCVDGLRVAGLAASLAGGKNAAEESARHLARGIQKEPKNTALLNEYAKALIRSGRIGDALRLLRPAVAVGTGIARRDAGVISTFGYALFRDGAEIDEIREALDNAMRANPDEETKAYVEAFREELEEWDRRRIWVEEFRRTGSKIIGWNEEDAALGVSISCVDNEFALFKGRVAAAGESDRKWTSLYRTEKLNRFIEVEARFKLDSLDTEFVFHIAKGKLTHPRDTDGGGRGAGAELAFVVTRDDTIELWATASGGSGRSSKNKNKNVAFELKDAEGNPLKWPRDGEFHTVRIERSDQDSGSCEVYLDGEPLWQGEDPLEINGFRKGTDDLRFGFQVDGDRGTNIDVRVDSVRLTRTVN